MDQRDKTGVYHLAKNCTVYKVTEYSYCSETKNSGIGHTCNSDEDKKCIQSTGTEISMKTPLSALAGKLMSNIKTPRLKKLKYQRPLLDSTLSQFHPPFISTTSPKSI